MIVSNILTKLLTNKRSQFLTNLLSSYKEIWRLTILILIKNRKKMAKKSYTKKPKLSRGLHGSLLRILRKVRFHSIIMKLSQSSHILLKEHPKISIIHNCLKFTKIWRIPTRPRFSIQFKFSWCPLRIHSTKTHGTKNKIILNSTIIRTKSLD